MDQLKVSSVRTKNFIYYVWVKPTRLRLLGFTQVEPFGNSLRIYRSGISRFQNDDYSLNPLVDIYFI